MSCAKSRSLWNVLNSLKSRHRFQAALSQTRRLASVSDKSDAARADAISAFKAYTQQGIGNKACVGVYSAGSQEYEKHMSALDFCGPQKMAETVASILKENKDAKILDAAAGSGLSGVALQSLGFSNVDAVDASKDLLQLASSKNVYREIFCHFLGGEQPMPVNDGAYDLVCLSGAVGENHLPPAAFDDLIRVVKSGGHMVNVFREAASRVPWYNEGGLEAYFDTREKEGKWKQVDRIVFPEFLKDMEGVVFVHQIL